MLGKKAQAARGTQQLLFLAAEILIGVGLIIIFSNMVVTQLSSAEEQRVARDIGLSAMVVESSPYDMYYRQPVMREATQVELSEGRVFVRSPRTTGVFTYPSMQNINVFNASFSRAITIPMRLSGNNLHFEEISLLEGLEAVCEALPARFPEDITFTFNVGTWKNVPERNYLQSLTEALSLILKVEEDFPEPQRANRNDVQVVIEFNEDDEDNSLNILYPVSREDASLQRTACFIKKGISESHNDYFTAFRDHARLESTQLIIRIGSSQALEEQPNPRTTLSEFSESIYRGIVRSVK